MNLFESRYEIPSDRVEEALAKGSLRETAEVCEWIMAIHLLRDLERELESTRLE